MKRAATLLLLAQIFAAGLVWPVAAQLSPPPQQGGRTLTAPRPAPPDLSTWSGRFNHAVQSTQQALHRQLADAMQLIKTQGLAASWVLVGLSFLYGVVHAIGPGHGKAVISSYLIADEQMVRRGIILSFAAAALQAVTAIAIVGVLAIALGAASQQMRGVSAWLETGSYALVALIGAWMLARQLIPALRGVHDHAHNHASKGTPEGESCGHHHGPDPVSLKGSWSFAKAAGIAFAVGLRPCTGAIVVLVFALANGLFLAGVGATFAMALGTAITVSVLAAMAVGSKQFALRLTRGNTLWAGRLYSGFSLLGSAALFALGVSLFIASLGPARPL